MNDYDITYKNSSFHDSIFWSSKRNTIFDLITALSALKIFKNTWKTCKIYTKGTLQNLY